jgi:hypothetical protein
MKKLLFLAGSSTRTPDSTFNKYGIDHVAEPIQKKMLEFFSENLLLEQPKKK